MKSPSMSKFPTNSETAQNTFWLKMQACIYTALPCLSRKTQDNPEKHISHEDVPPAMIPAASSGSQNAQVSEIPPVIPPLQLDDAVIPGIALPTLHPQESVREESSVSSSSSATDSD